MKQSKNIINDYTHANSEFRQLMKEGHDFAKFYGYSSSTNHNDSVDAFRHTYSNAYTAYKNGKLASKIIGDSYEILSQNPSKEKAMDYYNNQVGREIGEKLSKNISNMKFKNEDEIKQYIAFEVDRAIQEKRVITDLKDKRIEATLKNMPDHPLRIYTREDIDKMTKKEFKNKEKAIMKQMSEKGVPSKAEANAKVESGDGHWVTINGNHVFIEN